MNLQKLINWAAPLFGIVAIAYSAWSRAGVGGNSVVMVSREQPEAIGFYVEGHDPGPAEYSEIWEVTRVSDGDTITVKKAGEERKIRLCGIDAPESSQPGGREATEFVRDAIARGNGKVGLNFVETDRYGRWVAEVWSEPGDFPEQLLNSALIDSGLAWPYKQYWNNCPSLSALQYSEKSAEESGRAIWKQPGAIAPGDWRKQKK